MKFRYHPIDTLPALAWCARIDRGSDTVSAFHGKLVETRPLGFVEGAWNAPFESFNFLSATVLCGTGAVLDGCRVLFTSGTGKASPLYSIEEAESIFLSNSVYFAMGAAGEAPDDIYPFYPYDLIRIFREGMYCRSGDLRLRSGIPLQVHFATIISIDRERAVRFEDHELCAPFADYRAYHALLLEEMKRVFQNADDPARRRRYRPLAAISTGYDSSATAALASLAGCEEAVTFIDSQREDPREDSGAANARCLGMRCTEYDRWHYLKLGGRAEAEFAFVGLSTTTPLAAMEDQLEGTILVTAAAGDTVWGPERSACFNNLSQSWARHVCGLSQEEFRLRVGYLSFEPTYIGARHNELIHRIIESDEMRPWSVGGSYDRTIPRRIAEEAGLPRNQFGMRKIASGHSHANKPRYFSRKALMDYRDFVDRSHARVSRRTRHYWWLTAHCRRFIWKLFRYRRMRYVRSSPLQRRFPFILNAAPMRIPWDFMFTFQWAYESLRTRYLIPDHGETPGERHPHPGAAET
jgi:hypothetical protein